MSQTITVSIIRTALEGADLSPMGRIGTYLPETDDTGLPFLLPDMETRIEDDRDLDLLRSVLRPMGLRLSTDEHGPYCERQLAD